VFSVKSHYQALIQVEVPYLNKMIGRVEHLKKVKFFIWFLHKGVLLMKDNLTKRSWQGNMSCVCVFCHTNETIEHFFFECWFKEQFGHYFLANRIMLLTCLVHGCKAYLALGGE
jgi:hypothetical protein